MLFAEETDGCYMYSYDGGSPAAVQREQQQLELQHDLDQPNVLQELPPSFLPSTTRTYEPGFSEPGMFRQEEEGSSVDDTTLWAASLPSSYEEQHPSLTPIRSEHSISGTTTAADAGGITMSGGESLSIQHTSELAGYIDGCGGSSGSGFDGLSVSATPLLSSLSLPGGSRVSLQLPFQEQQQQQLQLLRQQQQYQQPQQPDPMQQQSLSGGYHVHDKQFGDVSGAKANDMSMSPVYLGNVSPQAKAMPTHQLDCSEPDPIQEDEWAQHAAGDDVV